MKVRLLSRADVERLLTWPETIRLQGEALGLLSAGEGVNPVKTLIAGRHPGGPPPDRHAHRRQRRPGHAAPGPPGRRRGRRVRRRRGGRGVPAGRLPRPARAHGLGLQPHRGAGTNAKAPVFDGGDLRPGTHVNSLGNSTGRELDAETVRRSKVFPDSRNGCLAYRRSPAATEAAGSASDRTNAPPAAEAAGRDVGPFSAAC